MSFELAPPPHKEQVAHLLGNEHEAPRQQQQPRIRRRQTRAFFALNLASIVEKMDEGVLPAVFFFVGKSLNASLPQLGTLTLCRALVQALASPFSGVVGDTYDRRLVVAVGAIVWGAMTAAIGMSKNLHQAMWACAANGLGLALVIPSISSLVADSNPAEERGRAFGVMSFTSATGGMAAALVATNIGGKTYYYLGGEIEGWRVAFHIVACVSFLTAWLVLRWAEDPRCRRKPSAPSSHDNTKKNDDNETVSKTIKAGSGGRSNEDQSDGDPGSFGGQGSESWLGRREDEQQEPPVRRRQRWWGWKRPRSMEMGRSLRDIGQVLKIRSFQVIVLQGIVGTMPWQAMVMFTLWFQLQGFSDFQASLLTAVYGFGCAVGSFLGGALGDWADKKLPARGRVIVVQLAIINGLPLSTLLLKGLPVPPVPIDTIEETISVGASSALCALYFFVLLCMGLVISWCGVNNSAIFADLVPERLRSQIYAFDRSFEGAVGACGAPLVGISAEKLFGFRGTMAAAATGAQERVAAAQALSSALLLCLIVPWLASLAFYCLLYWTYRADKLAAAKMSKVASGKGYAEVELGEGDMHHNERGLPSGLVTTAKGKVSVE